MFGVQVNQGVLKHRSFITRVHEGVDGSMHERETMKEEKVTREGRRKRNMMETRRVDEDRIKVYGRESEGGNEYE